MVVLKLQKVTGEIDELVKEQNNIWFQLHAMKKEVVCPRGTFSVKFGIYVRQTTIFRRGIK
jgi:hypothetical protein